MELILQMRRGGRQQQASWVYSGNLNPLLDAEPNQRGLEAIAGSARTGQTVVLKSTFEIPAPMDFAK